MRLSQAFCLIVAVVDVAVVVVYFVVFVVAILCPTTLAVPTVKYVFIYIAVTTIAVVIRDDKITQLPSL